MKEMCNIYEENPCKKAIMGLCFSGRVAIHQAIVLQVLSTNWLLMNAEGSDLCNICETQSLHPASDIGLLIVIAAIAL